MQYGTIDIAKRHTSSKHDMVSADMAKANMGLNNYQKVQSKIRTKGDELKQTYMNPAFGTHELKQKGSGLNSNRGSNSMAEKRYSKPNTDLEEIGGEPEPKFGSKILNDSTPLSKIQASMPSTQRYETEN